MSNRFIVPTFDGSAPNKVYNRLVVTGRNTVSRPDESSIGLWVSAIANESIPTTVDGESVFAVRIDDIGEHSYIMIGVSPMETFDSGKESYPGYKGMTGSALYLFNGNYYPGNKDNLIERKISMKAKEVIVVVTTANNGAQKLIRWIVNGITSDNHESTADCKGDKLFPVISFCDKNTQVTAIPLDQITIRNVEVNELLGKFSKQACAAPTYNQGSVHAWGPAVSSQTQQQQQQASSVSLAQLQQELEKERKRADLAEAQLKQEKQNSFLKDQQKDQLIQQQSSEITALKQKIQTAMQTLQS